MQTLNASGTSVAFSSDGHVIATAQSDAVVLRRVNDGSEVVRVPITRSIQVRALAFSPDGRYLAAGGMSIQPAPPSVALGGEVRVWRFDGTTATYKRTLSTGDAINAVASSPDSATLVAGGTTAESRGSPLGSWDFWSRRSIWQWRVSNGGRIRTIRTPHKAIAGLAFASNATTLVSRGYDQEMYGMLCVWRVSSGSRWWEWLIPASVVVAVVGWGAWAWRVRRAPPR